MAQTIHNITILEGLTFIYALIDNLPNKNVLLAIGAAILLGSYFLVVRTKIFDRRYTNMNNTEREAVSDLKNLIYEPKGCAEDTTFPDSAVQNHSTF